MVFQTPDDESPSHDKYMATMRAYATEQGIPTTFDAVENFHLFTVENFELVQHEVGCLADLIMRWMSDGDATVYCPSYDIYLRTVIEIIAVWGGESDHSQLRASADGLPTRAPGLFPDARELDTGPVLPTLTRVGGEVDMTNHPAFDRTVYEMSRARRSLRGPVTSATSSR